MKILLNILLVLTIIILINGCDLFKRTKNTSHLNGTQLYSFVISALDSSKIKSNPLKNFFNNTRDRSVNYNKIVVDSQLINGRKIYSILLEHPIPAFNLFGLIDDSLNLLLKDLSLNGYIDYEWRNINGKKVLAITEEFKSYEVYNLRRYSLYYPDSQNINLTFRTFTFFSSPEDSFYQNITEIKDDTIKTLIPKTKFVLKNDQKDFFVYIPTEKRFISNNNLFENIILNEINRTKYELTPNHLLNKKSINDILEYSSEQNTFIPDEQDFDINIPSDWSKISNVSLSTELSKNIKGIYFINQRLGSTIGIMKIPLTDSAETYVSYKLNSAKKIINYQVRESELKQDLKKVHKVTEHSCGNKKYILIFEASKSIYNENEQLFKNIISSFKLKC